MTLDDITKSVDTLIKSVHAMLHVGFFGLMCVGLLLASVFLWAGKLTGAEWVAICGILFGADRMGHALSARKQ